MSNARIIILETRCSDVDQYRNEFGELAICVPEGVDASVNKNTDELTELEKLTADYANSFEIVVDNVTKQILANVHFENISQNKERNVS